MGGALRVLCAVLALLCVASGARADDYPSKPVRILVGYPPGGSNDILARLVAQGLGQALKQPFVVENRAGGNMIIATEAAARSAADGYTLLVGASSNMTINPALYKKLPYDPQRDFVPITLMGSFPLVLAVDSRVPVKSVKELVALSHRPGQSLNYGSASLVFELATELFKQMSGANLYHVPYKGGTQVLSGMFGGDVQATIIDGAPLVPHIKAGRVRALAVTSATRSPLFPDLPTVAESGVPGYDMRLWVGLFAPTGTPPAIVEKLHTEIARFVQRPDIKAQLISMGIEPGGDDPAQVKAIINAETPRFAKIVRDADIEVE
jgi:tripartite-type tricarboxylate transporter receptor subunit TctC